MKLAVIDCAMLEPSHQCFNRLVDELPVKLHYHWPAKYGLESLLKREADAYMILGSYSNIEDQLDWHKELLEFAKGKLLKRHPVLGICFGHQLMAHGFGAEIGRCEAPRDGIREVNFHQHFWGVGGDSLKKKIIVHHSFELKTLPSEFVVVGSSSDCLYDCVAHKDLPYVGFQAHPEATDKFVATNLSKPELVSPEIYQSGMELIKNWTLEAQRFLQNS